MKQEGKKRLVRGLLAVVLLAGAAGLTWLELRPTGLGEGFARDRKSVV